MSWTQVIPGKAGESRQTNAWQLPSMDKAAPAVSKSAPSEDEGAAAQAEELERVRQAAYEEAFEQGKKDGYEAGFGEGREAGLGQGRAQARSLVETMGSLLDSLAAPAAELDEAVEMQLTEMVLAVAQQIIRRELQSQPGEVIGVIRETVGLLPLSARDVTVRLHPDDVVFVHEVLGDNATAWQLIEDPTITRGGCLVKTPSSRIDATLEHRIAAVTADLLGGARQDDREETA